MGKLPQAMGLRVIRALKKVGWYVHHQRGSHIYLKSDKHKGKLITVLVHGSKPVKKGTLARILKDANLSIDEFKELL